MYAIISRAPISKISDIMLRKIYTTGKRLADTDAEFTAIEPLRVSYFKLKTDLVDYMEEYGNAMYQAYGSPLYLYAMSDTDFTRIMNLGMYRYCNNPRLTDGSRDYEIDYKLDDSIYTIFKRANLKCNGPCEVILSNVSL